MERLIDLLYIFQLEGYDVKRFKRWLLTHLERKDLEQKKRLNWTLKARFLYLIALPFYLLSFFRFPEKALIFASYVISLPEWFLKSFIVFLAKVKISLRSDLIVIGITGSFGKTSVKEILAHLLSSNYKVLKTPESYNTPLGISRVVLQNLQKSHQVFIVEMGAYKKNEIRILCDVVKPTIGIITAIGKQHLERFGSLENIISTKFELVSSLPRHGVAFLNGNDKNICKEAKKFPASKLLFFGLNDKKNINNFFILASSILTSPSGSSFVLHSGGGEVKETRDFLFKKESPDERKTKEKFFRAKPDKIFESIKVNTPLLGKHNVLNILAATSVAYHLGMSLGEIAKQCSTLPIIPHRLQLILGAHGTIIIDDSFNANPDSVRAALEVLSDFPANRKIIITPGMIELGKEQYKENELMGEEMTRVADYIIVVGETNRKALRKGLEAGSWKLPAGSKILEVRNLNEATKKLSEIVVPGTVILFENDLPLQYR